MNNLIRATAVLAVLIAVFGCIVIAVEDSDAEGTTKFVSARGSDTDGDGSETSPYATLTKAVESIDSAGTVKFLTDFTMYDDDLVTIPAEKSITLDLNGMKGIPESGYSSNERYIVNHGTIVVTGNGTIDLNDETEYYGFVKNYGTLKVENGTFNGDRGSLASLFRNCNGGTATFVDGTYTEAATIINSEAGSITYFQGGNYSNGLYPALDVNGYTEITGGTFASSSCTTCNNGEFGYCVRSGLNDSDAHLLIKQAEGREITISGVQGALAIIGGTADIYDGNFTTHQCDNNDDTAHYACYIAGESYQTAATIYGGTFTSYDKPALFIGNSNAPPDSGRGEASVVNVKGGEFSVSNPDSGVKSLSVQNAGNAEGAASVTGGTFKGMTSDELDEYLPEGYEVGSDGQIKVSASAEFVAEINGTKYTTLSEAISHAFDGDTIGLIAVVNETGSLVIASDVAIDLNGLSHSVTSFTVNTNAELTIQDSVGTGILSTDGVTVNGTFTFLSGTMKQIQASTANYITSTNGTINLNGGKIDGVITTSYYAPVKIEGGILNMGGTEISGCSGYFGAIYASETIVKFTGGNITSNSSQRGTMGYNSMVYLMDCQTSIEDITISGNTQGYSMMAYWTKTGGSFSMTGGTLSDGSRMTLYLTSEDPGTNPTISIGGGTIIGEREAIEADFADQVFIDLSGSPTIDGEFFIYNSSTTSDAIVRLNNGFEPTQDVNIVLNSKPADGYTPVSVADGAESELEHVTVEYSNKSYFLVYKDGVVTIVEGVTLIFKDDLQGNELVRVDVAPGSRIPYDEIKDKLVVEDRDGYYYMWTDSDKVINFETYTVPEDASGSMTIYPYYYLEVPEVSVSADRAEAFIGETITITASVANHSDALTYTYAWSLDGQPMADKTSASITVTESGAYTVVVTVTDGNTTLSSGPSGAMSVTFTEKSPEPDQPFVPFPDDDDDYVPLPPHIVYEDASSDDSTTIAACAAAAVVAAILAVILITTYRRK